MNTIYMINMFQMKIQQQKCKRNHGKKIIKYFRLIIIIMKKIEQKTQFTRYYQPKINSKK